MKTQAPPAQRSRGAANFEWLNYVLGGFFYRRIMKIQTIIAFIIAFVLASCTPVPTPAPTEVLISAPTSTFTQVPQTPTPQSSSPVSSTPTSAAKLERWMEYENALAAVFFPLPYMPGKGLCEWIILGHSEHEVYVWAICQVADSAEGAAMSAPAVIYLAENDSIEKVNVPGDGSKYGVDIREMFPQDLQEEILSQSINSLDEMWAHIQLRHKKPEPPLIVEAGIALP